MCVSPSIWLCVCITALNSITFKLTWLWLSRKMARWLLFCFSSFFFFTSPTLAGAVVVVFLSSYFWWCLLLLSSPLLFLKVFYTTHMTGKGDSSTKLSVFESTTIEPVRKERERERERETPTETHEKSEANLFASYFLFSSTFSFSLSPSLSSHPMPGSSSNDPSQGAHQLKPQVNSINQ